MGHSDNCPDLTTRWNGNIEQCVPCPIVPGFEPTPNCGFDDVGGRHEPSKRACKSNTFNDGRQAKCLPCSPCPPGFSIESVCSSTADTLCQAPRTQSMTDAPVTTHGNQKTFTTGVTSADTKPNNSSQHGHPDVMWAVPLVLLVTIVFVLCFAFAIYKKKNRGRHTELSFRRKSSKSRDGFVLLFSPSANNDPEALLSPEIQSAPLQTLLDQLDILEQLVVLLDPDIPGVKNTKHLASYCSFTSTWITYTYSMKDSKSPLKAVLEGVISRNPDWTVGYLAKLLQQMERNDAVAVLSHLRPDKMAV